jgi:ABC-2 type transport system ATP-binding protein
MAEICAEGLGKTYGDSTVLHDLSFCARPGRVTGFLGPNGAGKTTTMRLMLGLSRGAGRTTFDGVPYDRFPRPLLRVGAVLDVSSHHPARRTRHHLGMLAASAALPRQRVTEVLAMVGLDAQLDARPKSFSLGMRQRLGLAAALLGDPDTLILDEPSNGLDPQGIDWLHRFLRAYVSNGNTVFLSSHLLATMHALVDDVVVIGDGRLIRSSPIDEFVDAVGGTRVIARCDDAPRLVQALRSRALEAYVEPDGAVAVMGDDQRQVAGIAADSGCLLFELFVRRPSLEDAYLAVSASETASDVALVQR